MPDLDGRETTRAIRSWELERGLQPVPVVAVTANTTELDRTECLHAGMDDYLCKPHTLPQLREKLRRILQLREARGVRATISLTPLSPFIPALWP